MANAPPPTPTRPTDDNVDDDETAEFCGEKAKALAPDDEASARSRANLFMIDIIYCMSSIFSLSIR